MSCVGNNETICTEADNETIWMGGDNETICKAWRQFVISNNS